MSPHSSPHSYDVAVVGLGAMGSAALHDLARRGKRVIGLERFEPGHDRGSSHGKSRVIRTAYFEGPDYVPLVRLAYDRWRALEASTGQKVLTITGIVEAGLPGSPVVEGTLGSAIAHGIPHEVLPAAEISRRFPAFTLPADWTCVFQPDGGVLEPEKAVRLFVSHAKALGAEVRSGVQVIAVEPHGDGVRVVLSNGEAVEAASAIIAAGPWTTDLVPALKPHLTLTRQPLIWFEPLDRALVQPGRMPVFLFETGEDLIYGMPDIAGSGVKAATHRPGAVLADGDAPRPDADEAEKAAILAALKAYIPAAAGPVSRTAACTYTRTPDEHFIIGPMPGAPQIVLASPCSGHGFKFASIIGEALADLALKGDTEIPIGLFSPGRFLA
jgi:sarcosine oxidase